MSYADLMRFVRETQALGQVAERLGWDQETVMPEGATPQRAEEHAAMAAVLHARRSDPRLGDWLARVTPEDEVQAANLRLIGAEFERVTKMPARLASDLARATSLGHRVWITARAEENVAAFLPALKEIIALRQEEADAVGQGGDRYDALLDSYEPGASGAQLAAMFDGLRPRLVALRAAILDAGPAPQVQGDFHAAGQLAISEKLASAFGYDRAHGRIDMAVHPFSSGSGLDVRITTRTSADPFNCFYSTIHEVGHAGYEQGIDRAHLLTPVGRGVSMGVHESQSRIYENQLGRSRAFTGWLYGQMRDTFGDIGVADEEAFFAAVNRVSNGFIRTEADEVQYNLHVLLRFDLERALIAGDLAVEDLEAAWNDRFAADFGVPVDRPSNGVLQDVHWAEGLFGYFPTYTLGNLYAGCLNAALRREVPALDTALARGDATPATAWLRETLQKFGGLREPVATIEHAIGGTPTDGPLLDYLEEKFGAIYGL